MISKDEMKSHTWDERPKAASNQGEAFTEDGRTDPEQARNVPASCKAPETAHTGHTETGTAPDVTPEMVTAFMREFEKWSPLLRYKEADGWHTVDRLGVRYGLIAALNAGPFPRPSVRDENRMSVTRDVRASFHQSVRQHMNSVARRLRKSFENWSFGGKGPQILLDAAAEIEQLDARNRQLEAELLTLAHQHVARSRAS